MHWAERTIESRLHAHQDFLAELGREQEFRQLDLRSLPGPRCALCQRKPGNPRHHLGRYRRQGGVGGAQRCDGHLRRRSTGRLPLKRPAGGAAHPLATWCRRDYREGSRAGLHDIILPVQRGSADLGAFIALQSLEGLLRATLPTVFTARYSLTVVSADNREVFSNTSVKPTDRQYPVRSALICRITASA